MSHKIKIDLCEVFGVEEGQEFRFDTTFWKYKIENNSLFVSDYSEYEDWWPSELPMNKMLAIDKIEILKPETPPEIKKMLQGFYDMGFTYFYYSDVSFGWIFKGNKVEEGFWDNNTFGEWADSFFINGRNSNKHFYIKDYI